MWRRQLSTFERSSKSGSRISVVVSLMAATVRAAIDEPSSALLERALLRLLKAFLCAAGAGGRGEPAHELLHTRLEHAAFGVQIGAQLVDSPPHLVLELAEPEVVRRDQFVVPALELTGDVRDTSLDPLGSCIPDVRQPLREHRLGFSRERAHRAVQLAGEALRRVLSRGLDELGESLRGFVRV